MIKAQGLDAGQTLRKSFSDARKGHLTATVIAAGGVGSELLQLLGDLGIKAIDGCSCLAVAVRMNGLGPAGCRRDRGDLVASMRANATWYRWTDWIRAGAAALVSGLAWRLDLADVLGSLLDEAIRRADAKLQPIDVLIPLGRGSKYDDYELRFALRSIARHGAGVRKIWIVGTIPEWIGETDQVVVVPRPECEANKAARIALKVSWAFENLPLTDEIAFWNDDYLLVQDCDVRTIPAVYSGDLWRRQARGWPSLLQHTAEALRAAGKGARHFDIHVPMRFERDKWLGLADWWERSGADWRGYVAKSVYGNHWCEAAVEGQDCKIGDGWRDRIERNSSERWVISYGNAALMTGFGDWMAARFPAETEAEIRPPGKLVSRTRPARVARPVIAVVGQFRGGTSAVAGVLHKLGVPMGCGWPRRKSNRKGTFEDRSLAQICRRAFHEPSLRQRLDGGEITRRLARWARQRHGRGLIGAKHPSLCLCVPEVVAAWPNVRFVRVERPAEESIKSIRSRMWGWTADQARAGTRRLIDTRDRDLDACGRPVLTIKYEDLLAQPAVEVDRLAEFCGVTVDDETRQAAIEFVDFEMRTIPPATHPFAVG